MKGKKPNASSRRGPSQNASANPNVLGNSGAYDPAFLQSAYNLSGASASAGAGATVAIVDAYDEPDAESDLGAYRSLFGLPPCTSADGCFRKVNQQGQAGQYPTADAGWGQEISLDVQMVSAICPNCRILLVEASSNNFNDLGTSVNTAVSMGAMAVSNSYGGGEGGFETSLDASYYKHPGIAITASSGDSGYGVEYPAASQYVTAVGGTTLNQLTNTGSRNATESVWSGAGSGCSAFETKPSWQKDAGCSRRSVADVAAVANPSTGVWVYDSSSGGWLVFGGTSVASPIIAAVYALAGTPGSGTFPNSFPYAGVSDLVDITSGSNGSCGGSYLCSARAGYDGPTGLGVPNGPSAFGGTRQLVAPALTGLSPSTGPATGGTSITISGTNFIGATGVAFGATPAASFNVGSTSQITATSPAGSGTVDVTITTAAGTTPIISADQFTFMAVAQAPVVTGVAPSSGPAAGGAAVTVTGTNFTGVTGVAFGGTPATSFNVGSLTQISATSPAGSGTVDVTVTTSAGSSATIAADKFTFNAAAQAPTVTGLSPSSGAPSGGTAVTISGTNFTGGTAVTFGGTSATFNVTSPSRIAATAPAGSGVVDVKVTTPAGSSATSVADQFTYNLVSQPPTIVGLAPSSGPAKGGTSVTIAGTNFSGATAVSFGGTAATHFSVTSATQINATAPAGAGTVDVTVTTAAGTSSKSSADQFTFTPAGTFSLSASPGDLAVRHKRSGQDSVTVTAVNGYSSTVNLSVSGVPSRTSASFSPASVAPGNSATLTISPGRNEVPGTYPLTITGTGGDGTTVKTTVQLTVF